jgi:nucleoside phosphorylase
LFCLANCKIGRVFVAVLLQSKSYDGPLTDFGVIVALDEEFVALRKAFGGFKDVTHEDARTFYHKRVIAKSDASRTYQIVVTFLNRMGQLAAAATTDDLMRAWRPQNVILCGLSGALHADIQLADVIFSDWILYYEPSKVTPTGVEPRYQMYPANEMLLNRMLAFVKDTDALRRWQSKCKNPNGEKVKHWQGTFASGESVIADEGAKEDLRKQHGKLAGVEMEAAGTFAAAFNSADPKRVIMVRGVCDRADSRKANIDKKGVWRAAAAFNAAKFVEQFIRFGNVAPLNCDKLELRIEPKAKRDTRLSRRMGFSYPFFDKLLIPRGPLVDVTLKVSVFGEKHRPLKILRAIWSKTQAGETSDVVLSNKNTVLSIPIVRDRPDYYSLHLEVGGSAKEFIFSTTGTAEPYKAKFRA